MPLTSAQKKQSTLKLAAVFSQDIEGKSNEAKMQQLDFKIPLPHHSELERKRVVEGKKVKSVVRKATHAKKKILKKLKPTDRLAQAQFKDEPYQIQLGVSSHVFCLACREDVNIKKDRIEHHTNSSKHKDLKTKYMQSLEAGKRVTNSLDQLLKQMFGSQQESALKDYVETSVMLAYNHRESQLHQLPEEQDLMEFFLLFFLCHDPASYLCITVSSITLILYVSF